LRTIPDEAQKKAVMKAFRNTDTYTQLLKDFEKSFKLMEAHTDARRPENNCYIIWSQILGHTIRVPFSEIEGGQK
jgi:ribulose bisphosphate carboxylase small subunit